MVRTTFEEIKWRGEKRVKCAADCGRTIKRVRTFSMTLNPWNVDPETGDPRTREQVWEALRAEATEWRLLPEWCSEDS